MHTQEVQLSSYEPRITAKFFQVKKRKNLISSLDTFFELSMDKSITPLKMNCYVSSRSDIANVDQKINSYKELSKCPLSIIVQPPLGGFSISMMLWYMKEKPERQTYRNNCMAVELKDGQKWFFFAHDRKHHKSNFDESAHLALNALFSNMEKLGFSYHNLLHTWFYIPRLTQISNGEERYQVFNKTRRKIYQKHINSENSLSFYPASTGIGCVNSGVSACAVAFQSKNSGSAKMIDNNFQVPAYYYPEKESIEPPLFSRGMSLSFDNKSIIFVSGTASILNAKTVYENDIAGQTHQTIKNIQALLHQNTKTDEDESAFDIKKVVKYAVVYIKQSKDYPEVKVICSSYFGEIPILFVQADICRDNLMVEIECIASF